MILSNIRATGRRINLHNSISTSLFLFLITFNVFGKVEPTVYSITKYEAENAILSGVSIASSVAGFSGSGYMDGGSLDIEGDKITFTVVVEQTAIYPLIIRFLNTCGACEKAQFITINGGPDIYTGFIGSSSTWQDLNYGNIELNAGENSIDISKSWGWTHIDYIGIGENDKTPPTAPTNLSVDDLTQTSFSLSWDAATDHIGVSTYQVFFDTLFKAETSITIFTFSGLTCNSVYPNITVRAGDDAGNVSKASPAVSVTTNPCLLYTLTVNNGSGSGLYNSGELVEVDADQPNNGKIFDRWKGSESVTNPALSKTTVIMPEGAVEITATYKDVDLTPLIDPEATAETVSLWNYLKSVYGQKMLTGCWTESQFGGHNSVVNCSGKIPAIWGQDMNSWYRDRNETLWKQTWNGNIEGFKKAHNRGQILQVNWHWQMVSSMIDGVYTRDAWGKDMKGNSQMMTPQQWKDIITSGTALFDAMIEDVDYHVVNFLKKIVDKNGNPIPIIFRPLHEIDGGWFWWTCKTDPAKTAKLFQLVYDRIVNFHGCHNLIWVYNPGVICDEGSWPPYQKSEFNRRKAFYPGDSFCDITGIDLYDFDPAVRGTYNTTGKTYRDAWNLMKVIAPDKMVALCEAEGMPDPEKCFNDSTYAPWLYCLPWYSEGYTDGTTGLTRDLCGWNNVQFNSSYVINAGDFILSSKNLQMGYGKKGVKIYPNPAAQSVILQFSPNSFHPDSKIDLIDTSGKSVFLCEKGQEDYLQLSLVEFTKGIYLIKISDRGKRVYEKLIVK